jgi:hypothetical protein
MRVSGSFPFVAAIDYGLLRATFEEPAEVRWRLTLRGSPGNATPSTGRGASPKFR